MVDPSNPFVQRETNPATATKPVTAPTPAQTPTAPISSKQKALLSQATAAPQGTAAVPTDPKQFQAYLNGKGAKPPLVVDGIIGPKTLAAAQTLGVQVPPEINPTAVAATAATPTQGASTAPAQQDGSQGTTDTSTPTPAPLTADEITAEMKVEYGNLGALLDYPDVAAALADVIRQHIDPNTPDGQRRAQAALAATPTYQNHQSNELNFLALKGPDQQSLIDANTATIGNQAKQMGVTLAPDRLTDIATNAAKYKWDADQISNAIAAEFQYKPGGQTGAIGTEELAAKGLAQRYGVSTLLDDATLASFDAQMANGTASPADIKAKIVLLAQQKYPGLAAQITDSNPTSNALAPYGLEAKAQLGLNPDTIDWTQPMWQKAIAQIDPKTGAHMPMSLSDWAQTLRSDPSYGWDRTPNGVAAGYATATALAKSLGVMA